MGESVYRKGYVDVGGGHKVYFECFGNQKSQPILFIHGGPGSGFTESHKKLFNPARFNVIFYDQRGAGKSKPYLSLEENTTQNLIEDIEKLRNFLQLEKLILIGSSWGATLALLYAIQYPQRVMGMVLMSVFLATRNEIENFVNGNTSINYPEIWERFVSIVPKEKRDNIATYYLDRMLYGSDEEKEKCYFNWALYDISLSTGEFAIETFEKPIREMAYQSLALLTAYYIVNGFFLPENYILEHVDTLKNIPIALIQGKADVITPPKMPTELHNCLPKSSLTFMEGLHADNKMKEKFVEEALKLASSIQGCAPNNTFSAASPSSNIVH